MKYIFTIIYGIMISAHSALAVLIDSPIKAESFEDVVKAFGALLKIIGIPLATIFLLWSGILFVTARGNEQQITKAKTTFFWTVIGTALLVGAIVIAEAIVDFAQKL